MIKTVFDTNVIVSALFWKDTAPDAILRLFVRRKIIVVESTALFNELDRSVEKLMKKYRFDRILFTTWRDVFERYALWVEACSDILVCRDPDDNKVLATALAGKAEYIITGDNDLLSLKEF